MDRQMSAALDRHITGNYGEDQYGEQPSCCEECPEEKFENCPGQDNCQEVYLATDCECGECQADMWATMDLDLTTAKDRVRLLKAGFTKNYPKRIEKLYLEQQGIKIMNIKTKELKICQ